LLIFDEKRAERSKRKQNAPEFTAKVGQEALKGEDTAAERVSRLGSSDDNPSMEASPV